MWLGAGEWCCECGWGLESGAVSVAGGWRVVLCRAELESGAV